MRRSINGIRINSYKLMREEERKIRMREEERKIRMREEERKIRMRVED